MKLFVDIKLDEKAMVTLPYLVSMKVALTKRVRLLSEAYRQWIKYLSNPQGRVFQIICNGQLKLLGLDFGKYVRTTVTSSFLKVSSSLDSMALLSGLMKEARYLQGSVKLYGGLAHRQVFSLVAWSQELDTRFIETQVDSKLTLELNIIINVLPKHDQRKLKGHQLKPKLEAIQPLEVQ